MIKEAQVSQRLPIIDVLRGVALVAMILFHILFNMVYIFENTWAINLYSQPLTQLFGRCVAGLFIVLAGASLIISHERRQAKGESDKDKIRADFKRAGLLFGWGLVITVVTSVLVPAAPVWFGILHFMGVSVVCGAVLARFISRRWWLLVSGLCLSIGLALYHVRWPFWWGLPLGLVPAGFVSLDYFPLLPWFSVFVAGMWLAEIIYHSDKAKASLNFPFSISLAWLGKHSLTVYLIHQPILIAILWLLGRIKALS